MPLATILALTFSILALTRSTASLGSFDSSSRMPGSVTPSRRCSGSAATCVIIST